MQRRNVHSIGRSCFEESLDHRQQTTTRPGPKGEVLQYSLFLAAESHAAKKLHDPSGETIVAFESLVDRNDWALCFAALHKLRIRSKELRYAMELLAGAFPLDFRGKLYPIIETLQDKLGEINDRATAQVRLRQRIKSADDKAEVDYLRKLRAEERLKLKQARREFLDWCTQQLRKDLRAGFDALLAKMVTSCRCANAPGSRTGVGQQPVKNQRRSRSDSRRLVH